MFDFSINQRSKGAISSVSALFRVVEALERLRCFKSGMDFGVDVHAALRKWLGVTPNHLWVEDDTDEICIVFSLKDESSSNWEEYSMYVNREGELSSTYLPQSKLDMFQQGLGQLFK